MAKKFEYLRRGAQDGRERDSGNNIYDLARQYGIDDPRVAENLYSQAHQLQHQPSGVWQQYEHLLREWATPRPAPGKQSRTAAIYGATAPWEGPQPGVTPGKRTRTMALAQEIDKREQYFQARERAENARRSGVPLGNAAHLPGYNEVMAALRELDAAVGLPPESPASDPRPGEQTPEVAEPPGPKPTDKATASPAEANQVIRQRNEQRLHTDTLAAFGHFAVPNPAQPNPAEIATAVQRKQTQQPDAVERSPQPSGSGTALPDDVRDSMERAFGVDFAAVRIHEGAQAEALDALAYTQGTDIHFQPGQYNPHSQPGRELLGHELAHVVQQAQGRVQSTTQARGVGINDDPSLEREADEMGAKAARGEAISRGRQKADSVDRARDARDDGHSRSGERALGRRQERLDSETHRGPIQRQSGAKAKGAASYKRARDWIDTDAEVKKLVDVLKAALREVKRGKSVNYNKNAGIKKLKSLAPLLSLSKSATASRESDWKWLVDNRQQHTANSYKHKEQSFFRALHSELALKKVSFPKQQTHYWLKNTPKQIFLLVHDIADKTLPADELWAYASKEGLVDYTRGQISGLSTHDTPTTAQLDKVPTDRPIDGFVYLGLDDYRDDLNAKRKPMKNYLPKSFDHTKTTPIQRTNEQGRTVNSARFDDLKTALQAFSANIKRRRDLFLEDAKTYGYASPNRDELVYWTYIYYNVGEYGGKNQLKKYKGKRKLSDWIKKGEYSNSIKLLQSYKMVRSMGIF